MALTLEQLITSAKEALEEALYYEPDIEYPEDRIHEITDNACLLPNHTYLQLAADNMELALEEPELGPAFDGRPTPVNIICANLYEHISQELFQHLYSLQEQREAA